MGPKFTPMENLGRKAKDNVTGFEGVLTAYMFYYRGGENYLLEAKGEAGKEPTSVWFAVGRVEFLET